MSSDVVQKLHELADCSYATKLFSEDWVARLEACQQQVDALKVKEVGQERLQLLKDALACERKWIAGKNNLSIGAYVLLVGMCVGTSASMVFGENFFQ